MLILATGFLTGLSAGLAGTIASAPNVPSDRWRAIGAVVCGIAAVICGAHL